MLENKKWVIIMLVLGMMMITGCGNEKTGKEILETLEYNDYQVTYQFSPYGNTYDIDRTCYDYDGKETTCIRELVDDEWTSITVDVVSKLDSNRLWRISASDDNGILSYTDENQDGSFTYMKAENGSEVNVYFDGTDSTSCTYMIKTNASVEFWEKCTRSQEQKIEVFLNEMQTELKDMGITEKDLFTLGRYLVSEYGEPHREELKNNDRELSNEETETIIEERGFLVEKSSYSTYDVVLLSDSFNRLFFFIADDEVAFVGYNFLVYDVSLYIFPSSNTVAAISDSESCQYNMIISGQEVNQVEEGSSCTEEEISDIKMIREHYDILLKNGLGLKESELFAFAIYYNQTY